MKNKFFKVITTGLLCATLVSNHFIAFAEEVDSFDELITEEMQEEVIETSEEVVEEETPVEEEQEEEVIVEEDTSNESSSEEEIEVEYSSAETTIEEIVEVINMPAVSGSSSQNGMNVSVNADEGAFPEGTTVSISIIDDNTAVEMAENVLGDNVTSAKAVDITFFGPNGIELQPAIPNAVHVNISLDNALEGDNFTVLHDHNGDISPIGANVDNDSASFSSDEFSVFIVVGTDEDNEDDEREVATYKFFVWGEDSWVPFDGAEEQYIKGGDILYNPGTPSIDPDKNEEFLGWEYEDGTAVTFGTIDSVTAGDIVNIRANIATTYYVTFVGVENDVVQVKKIPATQGENAYTTVNDIPYTVQKSTQAFKGWTTTQGDESTLITNNSINAKEVSHVYADVIDAFWIHFDENDDLYDADGNKISSGGASFVGPVAVEQTKTPRTSIGTIPESTRKGYEFLGWYYGTKGSDNNVTLGDPFNWDTPLTEDVTIYAKWEAHTDTVFTVNIWKEKLNGGYDYVANASSTYNGTTGAKITCYQNYFHLDNPSGNYSYYPSGTDMKGFSYNHADIVNGVNDTISAKGDTVINVYYNRNTYTLTFQTWQSSFIGGRWVNLTTISAKYEENIANKFPIKVGNTTYNNFWEVQGNPETYVSGLLVGKIDIMPAENITFHRYTSQGQTFNATWNYYIETIDGAAGTTTYDSKNFNLRNAVILEVTSGMQSTEAEEFMDIRGFTKYKANPAFVNGVQDIVPNKPINLYYTRNNYTLTFMDGDNTLKTIKDIPYEKSLQSYETQAPAMADKDGQKFIGWYADKSCTIPFEWTTTMPIGGQLVYAKYANIRFRVTLDPNGGTIDTTKQAISFMEDYNGKLDSNSINKATSRTDWELIGWFYADGPKAGQAYDWDKITETTTDYTYDAEKGIYVGTVNIKAGWRFPGLVHIKYDAGENGTNAPTADQYGYAYNSTVVVDRPSKPNQGYRFIGWTIKNDTDTSRILYPNSSFAIDIAFVKDETITLVAKYEEIGGSGTSTALVDITYHSNDGEDNTYVVEGLKVNKSVDAATLEEAFGEGYTRTGYKFLGWSKTEGDNNEVWLEAGTAYVIAADEDEPSNDLYAAWEPAKKITYTDGVEDEVIFIDEVYDGFVGEATPTFSDESTISREGWTFDGWNPEVDETVTDDATYTAKWVEDYTVTKEVKYTVQHVVDNGEPQDAVDYKDNIWINAEEDVLNIQEGSLTPNEYYGYKFDSISPDVKEGDPVNDGDTITLYYIPDETVTVDINYTVNHIVDGETKDTVIETQPVWVHAEEKLLTVTSESLALNTYENYVYSKTVYDGTEEEAKVEDEVEDGTIINIIYEPKTINARYEYRFANEDEKPDVMPELPKPFTVKFGDDIELIDLPTIEGFTLSDWEIEEDKANTSDMMPMSNSLKKSVPAPAHNIVIYTIVTKDKVEPEPDPEPTPRPKPKPTPQPEPEKKEIEDEPVALAAAPQVIVQTPVITGARMAWTGDRFIHDSIERWSIIIGCIALLVIMLIFSKKEK